jgi:hypothetical protein
MSIILWTILGVNKEEEGGRGRLASLNLGVVLTRADVQGSALTEEKPSSVGS